MSTGLVVALPRFSGSDLSGFNFPCHGQINVERGAVLPAALHQDFSQMGLDGFAHQKHYQSHLFAAGLAAVNLFNGLNQRGIIRCDNLAIFSIQHIGNAPHNGATFPQSRC